jgi:cAMP phosphodiesterase
MNNTSEQIGTPILRGLDGAQPAPTTRRGRGRGRRPALQVTCLGASGGPSEENATAFLVRSLATEWAKGSVLAVDAGSHLAPITRIVERDFALTKQRADADDERREVAKGTQTPGLSNDLARTSLSPIHNTHYNELDTESSEAEETPKPEPIYMTYGPFAGMKLPHASARANALHFLQTYISTYLITHPHLDHISGFAINTAAFHATSKPKTLAALPGTVNAIKRHIFNDVIWPNLSDEDGGVGFVTFQRLKEGGDAMVGEGEGRGYIDVCDGLGAKAFKVSHGVCTKSPPAHQHRGSVPNIADTNHGSTDLSAQSMARTMSFNAQYSAPGTPGQTPRQSFHNNNQPSPRIHPQESSCVVDSTAYFIRDSETGREILIFGDVEPDSLSLTPRNYIIWAEAARKIASGSLTGILIECSYKDSHPDAYLFGHLAPRHLVAELVTLGGMVREARVHMEGDERQAKKRKRSAGISSGQVARYAVGESESKRSRSLASRAVSQNFRRRSEPDHPGPGSSPMQASTGPPSPSAMAPTSDAALDVPTSPMSRTHAQLQSQNPNQAHPHFGPNGFTKASTFDLGEAAATPEPPGVPWEPPLKGLKVVVIHVKDTFKDGPHVSESIFEELNSHEQALKDEGKGLGCEFVISKSGECYWF